MKIKQALPETVQLLTPLDVSYLGGCIRSEQPNNSLYTFEGTLLMNSTSGNPKELPLDPTQVLLRVSHMYQKESHMMYDKHERMAKFDISHRALYFATLAGSMELSSLLDMNPS